MATNKNNFLIQGSILAVAGILVRIIGLIYRLPMTNIIGDEGMGTYGIAFGIYNLALILSSYGLPLAVSKLVATRIGNREYKNAHRIFTLGLIFAFVVGTIATAILFIGAEFFATVINNDPYAVLPLRVLAPTILVFSIMGVIRGYFQGKNTMIPTAISQLIEQVINAIVSVAAAYFLMMNFDASPNVVSYGAAGGTLGTLIGAIGGLLFLIFIYMIYRPYQRKKIRKDKTEFIESYSDITKFLLLTIGPIILSQTVYHLNGVLDNSFFSNIMASKEVTSFELPIFPELAAGDLYSELAIRMLIGKYTNKYLTLTNIPVAIASSIGVAIVTSIAVAKARRDEETIAYNTHAAIKFNMIIAIPSAIGMAVLASPIMNLLFKDSHELEANFLRLGSIAIVFYAFSTVTTAILQGINKLRIPVINSAISLGIHIVLLLGLLKFTNLSSYSLVIGNVTFALVVCILNWISIERHIRYRQEITRTFLIPTISAGLMGIITHFVYMGLYAVFASNVIALGISIVFAVIIYFSLLIFMKGINESELLRFPKGHLIVKLARKIKLL